MQEYITIPVTIMAYQVGNEWIVIIEGEKIKVSEKIFNSLFMLKVDYEVIQGNNEHLT